MKRIDYIRITVIAALCLCLTACTKDDKEQPETKGKALVAILKNGNIDYWQQVAYSFTEECKAQGMTPFVYFTKDEINASTQVSIVRSLEKFDYDIQGIAFAPIWTPEDRSAEQAVAEFASARGIPVSIVDSPIDEKTSPLKDVYCSYVGTDNLNAGKELARKIPAKSDEILVIRDESSTPTMERHQGICAEKGQVELWSTNARGLKDIGRHLDGKTTVVFLNGHLCKQVLNELGIYDVYTFDVYNEYAPLLDEETFMKGVVAQNTLEMGRQCVIDLLKAPADKAHNIPTIYLTNEVLKSPTEDAKPLLKYLQDNSPFKDKAVLLALGTETYQYWRNIGKGAQDKAKELGVDLHLVYNPTDTVWQVAAKAIEECGSISNLVGVAGQINKEGLDAACAGIPAGVNLTLIEGLGYYGGVSEQRYTATVSLNNAHYAKEFLSRIPEKKLIVLSYSTGNNVPLTEEYIALRGASNIRPIYLADAAYALDSLQAMGADIKGYDAVIFNSGYFLTPECMQYLKGMTMYSSDLDEKVADYIRSGEIRLNISPDPFSFGRLILLSAITGASYEVPYILTDKTNVDTPERTNFWHLP